MNISSNDINSIAPKNTFLYNVLKAWSVINEKYKPTRNNIGKTNLVDKKTVFYDSYTNKEYLAFNIFLIIETNVLYNLHKMQFLYGLHDCEFL